MKRRHELPFGAEPVADGVRFRLWAPKARSVALALEGRAAVPMTAEPDGWYALTTRAAAAGSRYRYIVDGQGVPDPAARFQPQDVHGASEVVDAEAYDWQDGAWHGCKWEEIVLYELHVGTFSESGDYAGVARHLDHLAALGVTALELMPLATFAGRRGWGYDGVLPFAPAPCYGRPEELKRLVDACHRRGFAVFLDVVYNHFGPEGNYLGLYAPDFFTDRYETPWGAAINFAAEPVRRFYVENALYWLEEFNFDGLRFDAVHAIFDDSPRHILTEIAEAVDARVRRHRPVHLVLENDRNEAWLLGRDGPYAGYAAQWNDDLHHAPHVIVTSESGGCYADYADRPVAHLGRALAEGFVYQGEASPFRRGERRGEPSAHLPPTAFVAFIQNHDQVGNTPTGARLSHIAEEDMVRLVAAIVILSPQIPMLFMGEEWATARPFPYFCDFGDELCAKVREGRKREFNAVAGFHGELPDPCDEATLLSARLDWTARDEPVHRRWLDWYRTIIAIRRRELVPLLDGAPGGAAHYETIGLDALRVTWCLAGGAEWMLHANVGRSPQTLSAPPKGRLIFATTPVSEPAIVPPRAVMFHLAAHG